MKSKRRKSRKFYTPVVARVFRVVSPYGGIVRGYRLIAAYPNQDGSAFGYPCQSFAEVYQAHMIGDYPTEELARSKIPLFRQECRERKLTITEWM